MAKQPSARTRRDRWADWAVIGVLVLALFWGWAVMALAQGQRDTYTNADADLTVRYPRNWLHKETESTVFRAVDPGSGSYKTTYEVRTELIDPARVTTGTLAIVLNNTSLSRAQKATAYRTFDVVEGKIIDGRPSMESTYVFVHEGSDLFVQQMPVVVLGLDIAVAEGDQAYIFTLLAAQDDFAEAEKAFRKFVRSAEFH